MSRFKTSIIIGACVALGMTLAPMPKREPLPARTLPEDPHARRRRSRRLGRTMLLGTARATPAELATVAWKGQAKGSRAERKAARAKARARDAGGACHICSRGDDCDVRCDRCSRYASLVGRMAPSSAEKAERDSLRAWLRSLGADPGWEPPPPRALEDDETEIPS